MPTVALQPANKQPTVTATDDTILRAMRPGVGAGMQQLADVSVAFLLENLSKPVVYLGNGDIERSLPGEFPRMEENLLRQSADAEVIPTETLPFLRVSLGPRPGGDPNVAWILEDQMDRPSMEFTRQMLVREAKGEMQQALNRTLK